MSFLKVRGAREHNLKDIDVDIPKEKLVVITGLSGSGKSSLAFDTIYAEGQRRYVESLSAYARQFLGLMEKPDVESISGLQPAISIDQKTASSTPRSTVGTVTEIYDYLRLLFARVGIPHCPICGRKVERQSIDQIIEQVLKTKFKRVLILAPLEEGRKGEYKELFARMRRQGYLRLRIDGKLLELDHKEPTLDKKKKHRIEVVVDRLELDDSKDTRSRLAGSLELALRLGEGFVRVVDFESGKEQFFSEEFACPKCELSLPPLSPQLFSFNSPQGACPYCTGLGVVQEIDPELIIPNPRLTIAEGGIKPLAQTLSHRSFTSRLFEALAKQYKFSLHKPIKNLPKKALEVVLYGTGDEEIPVEYFDDRGRTHLFYHVFEGIIPQLKRRYKETDSDFIRSEIGRFMTTKICPQCQGARLRREAQGVLVGGKSIVEVVKFSIEEAAFLFEKLTLNEKEKLIAKQILKEVKERLNFLLQVGLPYLTLDRVASSLSGGEAQRIRLATQIGSGLSGVVYILDEPSIGLHPHDNHKLILTLKDLRDLGNTVIVVEHDADMILNADWVVDMGPGAGERGGEVVASGSPQSIKKAPASLTGAYLSGKKRIAIPTRRRLGNGDRLEILGASEFNLKDIDVEIPLGTFTCVTGLSGSGKSTLILEILAKKLNQIFYRAKEKPGAHREIRGLSYIDKVIDIDQSPIGRTPRSNPATYTGVFTEIRKLFSELPEARLRGYSPGRFSFNVRGGRCENCRGDGVIKIEMHFLPDVYVPCEVCKGKRYNQEVLEIRYKGKNISDVLEMTVMEAREFFSNIPTIKNKLETLKQVGLGYIELGQPATQLSGGEAQRVKLATELSRRATGKTLYILDEPTTGLHFDDIKQLLSVLHELVERGNTVLVIEHNPDVVKTADYIIDLGPEGGDEGGEVVAVGTPEEVAKVKKSYTGQYLKRVLRA